MSILDDGSLAAEFYDVLAPLYADATLRRVTLTDDGSGSYTPSNDDMAVKAQRDDMNEAMRAAAGYTDRDVRFLVLAQGLAEPIDSDCRLIYGGETYLVSSARTDPAGAYWECRCRRA